MPEPGSEADEAVRDARQAVYRVDQGRQLASQQVTLMSDDLNLEAALDAYEAAIRASERANQQEREWGIAESEFQRGHAAGRASERERYAPLVKAATRVALEVSYGHEGVVGMHTVKVAHVDVESLQAFYAALAVLEEAESA